MLFTVGGYLLLLSVNCSYTKAWSYTVFGSDCLSFFSVSSRRWEIMQVCPIHFRQEADRPTAQWGVSLWPSEAPLPAHIHYSRYDTWVWNVPLRSVTNTHYIHEVKCINTWSKPLNKWGVNTSDLRLWKRNMNINFDPPVCHFTFFVINKLFMCLL